MPSSTSSFVRFAAPFVLLASLALPAPALLAADVTPPVAQIAESYKLPISPPLDQGDSNLCWIYATLSMLETNYLAEHPDSKIELSRAALQRATIADRFRRLVTGDSAYLHDGGVAVDALKLIREHGLFAVKDFHPVVEAKPVWEKVSQTLAEIAGGETDRLAALYGALAGELGVLPHKTELDGRSLSPQQLAKIMLGGKVWTEFDVAQKGEPRVGPSPDPDARPGTQVHYVDLPTAVSLIHDSLKNKQAVVWGTSDHAMLIYGADYDAEGRPLAYWIKDSFPPYTHRAPAEEVHKELTDVTVAVTPEDDSETAEN